MPWHAAPNKLSSTLLNKHAISVGVETVALSDGVVVGAEDVFCSCQSADQHQERRLGQVEVGEQSLDQPEFVAGIDEEIGFAGAGLDFTRLCGVFESADRGGAYGYDAAGFAPCLTDLCGGFFRDRIGLGVERVLFDFLDAHWLEGAESDVEGHFCGLDAAVVEAGEDLRSEVEASCGGGDRSALSGVDGLVAVAVGSRIVAGDVRRKRDVADSFYSCEKVVHRSETDVALAKFAAGDDLSLELVIIAEGKVLADSDFAARADETFPIVRVALQLACEQDFDLAAKKIA